MKTLFTALAEELSAGRGAVVATVVASRGSTPRGPGARMLVRAGGSALGTVGLTVGVTEVAGVTSRLVLCVLMYLGRAGLLTIALACGREDAESAIRYPLGEIMIG